VAVIFISLIFFLNKYEKFISLIVGLFFILGAIISFYHFGIEQGFFSESLICDLGNKNTATSSQDLLKQLEKETISCKNVTFRVLGLSLATNNTIITLIIGAIMHRIVINYDKNK
jgi:disulfide bond formation protein DsbB